MQHRTIEAEVHELKGRLIVIKSDELDQHSLDALTKSFRKRGVEIIGILGLGSQDGFETIDVHTAKRLLNHIIEQEEKK